MTAPDQDVGRSGDGADPKTAHAPRILLVEDNPVVAAGVTRQLQQRRYEVTHLVTAAEAKAALQSACPDLMILDVGLPTTDPDSPVWDGLDLLQWMDWMQIDVPVIVYSNTETATIQRRNPAREPVAYVEKAAGIRDLLATVAATLPPATRETVAA